MKFNFSFFLFLVTIQGTFSSPLIVLSGEKNPIQKKVLENLLEVKYPSLKQLVVEQPQNKDCRKEKMALLQLCFLGNKILVITSKKKKLKKTVERLMVLVEQTE
ncbi:MAG: hypothetical protein NXH75_16365 [Halobacteriovoraceae bacterium]|nr:hypothetical protein [Halobacteriovoraceae bacterium]